jgi:hypothetical protein
MNKREITQTIKEMRLILEHPDVLKQSGFTLEQVMHVNLHKQIAMCFYYWNLIPKNETVLKCLENVQQDETFEYINKKISDMWEKKAKKEIAEVIEEMEKTPIADQ